MTDFLQLFFSGLATGSIYALAALGFTLLWQASGTINFAQGEFVMLPAFMMVMLLGFGVLRLGFLDGWRGLLMAIVLGQYAFHKYAALATMVADAKANSVSG